MKNGRLSFRQVFRDKRQKADKVPRLLTERPLRLVVRTLAFHAGDTGSSPVGVATFPPPSSFCRFARAFQCEIGSITPALVQRFLNNLNLSARSVNNFRKTLKTLFEFARARRYLSKEIDLLEGISRQREHSTIEIYTPQEMAALLSAAAKTPLFSIALRGFAGPF